MTNFLLYRPNFFSGMGLIYIPLDPINPTGRPGDYVVVKRSVLWSNVYFVSIILM